LEPESLETDQLQDPEVQELANTDHSATVIELGSRSVSQTATVEMPNGSEPSKKKPRKRRFGVTDRDDELNLVELYFREISQFDLLSAEEEVALAQRMEAGVAARAHLEEPGRRRSTKKWAEDEALAEDGELARQTFINANLRLVVSLVKPYQRKSDLKLMDLIQAGNIGLQTAVDKFDWRRGLRFSTMAAWWIRQAAQREMGTHGRPVRLPQHVVTMIGSIGRRQANGLDDATIMRELSLKETELEEYRRLGAESFPSLDAPLSKADDRLLGDVVADEHNGQSVEDMDGHLLAETLLAAARRILPERDAHLYAQILSLRLGSSGETMEDLASKYAMDLRGPYRIEQRVRALAHHPVLGLSMHSLPNKEWQAEADCTGQDPTLFFPERGVKPNVHEYAKSFCEKCPVREHCEEFIDRHATFPGIWAGNSEKARRYKRRAAKYATEE
jgi:RNA polymerase sigma factor (sigma-70 family)